MHATDPALSDLRPANSWCGSGTAPFWVRRRCLLTGRSRSTPSRVQATGSPSSCASATIPQCLRTRSLRDDDHRSSPASSDVLEVVVDAFDAGTGGGVERLRFLVVAAAALRGLTFF